ncbi:MAG TPA: hypothetical protein VH120_18175, partial [Gemmataceae bacterium]|nr:hypothetical protein [Gemmataceae bacterium]
MIMATATAHGNAFVDSLRKSRLLDDRKIDELAACLPAGADATVTARRFVKAGLITKFQANCIAQGKWRNLIIADKYKIIDYL